MTTLEIINLIESDKKRKRICPDHACKIEVIKAAQAMNMIFANEIIESELIELKRAGKIKIGDTLNDNYIIIL